MKYIEATACRLHYELPLNEIIYDFFDAAEIPHAAATPPSIMS